MSAADTVTITVLDDGKSTAEKNLRTAMAHFGQVEPSMGSGLGLPIAMAVAEAFGGTMVLKSNNGQFSISMILPNG